MTERCPNCNTHPLGSGFVASMETRGGVEIEAIICGDCGTVFVEDPAEQVHQGAIDQVANAEADE